MRIFNIYCPVSSYTNSADMSRRCGGHQEGVQVFAGEEYEGIQEERYEGMLRMML